MPLSRHMPLPVTSLLDVGDVPVGQLAAFAHREASRPRPAYLAHRWFARRFGTAMRALLVAAATPAGGDFWEGFYGTGRLSLTGVHVLDPFVGGGTILYEAQRLGANVTGIDVDPVACAVSRFLLRAGSFPDPTPALQEVWHAVGKRLSRYYRTRVGDQDRIALHYLWVQVVECPACGMRFDAHPSHLLGVAGDDAWVVCPTCGDVRLQEAEAETIACRCGNRASVEAAAASGGTVTCPGCGCRRRLVDLGRQAGLPPRWRMFAVESIPDTGRRRVPMAERVFHRATAEDLALYQAAEAELATVAHHVPARPIPRTGRADTRLVDYGYQRYSDLFNARQLLHLVLSSRAIARLDAPSREMLGLALSNHLTSNCMLTSYSPRWRQATPLFAVRAYRHSRRPAELNPWLAGVGRGTFPNAVRQVGAAIAYTRDPVEHTAEGFAPVARMPGGRADILRADSRNIPALADHSVDLIVTDPPYLDNIAYTELADFYVPWLAATGVLDRRRNDTAKVTLAANGRERGDRDAFAEGFAACLAEVRRVVRPGGRLVFTFQHSTPGAWEAVAAALCRSGFDAVNVMPLRGNSDKGIHHKGGSSTWDAVFVLRPGEPRPAPAALTGPAHVAVLEAHADGWAGRLDLAGPDRKVLRRATLTAGSAGFLQPPEGEPIPLVELL